MRLLAGVVIVRLLALLVGGALLARTVLARGPAGQVRATVVPETRVREVAQ